MIAIVVCLLIVIPAPFIGWRLAHWGPEKSAYAMTALVLAACVAGLVFYPLCGVTGGLFPNYSEGDRLGYITKASRKGIIWTTNEVEMQIGTGEMAALQSPHPLSIPDDELFEQVVSRIGDKCKVHYEQWLIMPFWVGKSGYEVKRIEWIDSADQKGR